MLADNPEAPADPDEEPEEPEELVLAATGVSSVTLVKSNSTSAPAAFGLGREGSEIQASFSVSYAQTAFVRLAVALLKLVTPPAM